MRKKILITREGKKGENGSQKKRGQEKILKYGIRS